MNMTAYKIYAILGIGIIILITIITAYAMRQNYYYQEVDKRLNSIHQNNSRLDTMPEGKEWIKLRRENNKIIQECDSLLLLW